MNVTDLPPLPQRPDDANKGTFGRAMLIGGSVGMSGSISLAGISALRSGAGLVYLGVPTPIQPTVAGFDPSYLTVGLVADQGGRIREDAISVITEQLEKMDVCAIGPGLGQSSGLRQLVSQLFRSQPLPVVVDADALNSLALNRECLSDHAGPRVLTPHPGEFARLIDSDVQHVQRNREELAVDFANAHGVVLVLKGAQTIVTDGDRVFCNTTGNSGMATGGTGDVLTGVITGLLAQQMESFEAAQLGVYVHGLSGDLAAVELSEIGLIASDLPRYLCQAWKRLR